MMLKDQGQDHQPDFRQFPHNDHPDLSGSWIWQKTKIFVKTVLPFYKEVGNGFLDGSQHAAT
jgi:hypothetical protein